MRLCFLHILSACFVLSVLGCGDDSVESRIAIRGKVNLDGQPLERALIRFMPKQDGLVAVAVVNDGEFELDPLDGPSPGEHSVIVTPEEPEFEEAVELIQRGNRDPLSAKTVPVKYQKRGMLDANVVSGSINFFQFDLRSR